MNRTYAVLRNRSRAWKAVATILALPLLTAAMIAGVNGTFDTTVRPKPSNPPGSFTERDTMEIKYTPNGNAACKEIYLVQTCRMTDQNGVLVQPKSLNGMKFKSFQPDMTPGGTFVDHLPTEKDPYYNGLDDPQDGFDPGYSFLGLNLPTGMSDIPGMKAALPPGVTKLTCTFEVCAVCKDNGQVLDCITWKYVYDSTVLGEGMIEDATGPAAPPSQEFKDALKQFWKIHRYGLICPEEEAEKNRPGGNAIPGWPWSEPRYPHPGQSTQMNWLLVNQGGTNLYNVPWQVTYTDPLGSYPLASGTIPNLENFDYAGLAFGVPPVGPGNIATLLLEIDPANSVPEYDEGNNTASVTIDASGIVYEGSPRINEVRIDQPGTDTDEYFELSGTPLASLDNLTYVVVGDRPATQCGVIEAVIPLSTLALGPDGYFAAVKSDSATLTGYDLTHEPAINFENTDNVTHMLVAGFSGTLDQDLDTNDDGVLDVTPWTSIVDRVSPINGLAPNCAALSNLDWWYSPVTVGPDGNNVPGHVWRCSDTGAWMVGSFNITGGQDTPGSPNPGCTVPPPPAVVYDRANAIWARRTTENIVLNGILNEASWASAESMSVGFGIDNGVPGSGWKIEAGVSPGDSTYATLKLLVKDNQMYLGAKVRDTSIGGSQLFNRFDGFLMAIKDHLSGLDPKPPAEYFYSWWNPEVPDPQPVGKTPNFIGRWGSLPIGSPRDPVSIANWDAVTVVNGTTNSDATNDAGYTVEMRFNLTPMGYNVTQPEGDIVEWNISIYDCDWNWPISGQFSSTRSWWESPWGNAAWYDEVRVYARPAVTVASGPVPLIQPDFVVPEAIGYTAPTINGTLTEPVWAQTPSFRIRYGDSAVRQSYPGVGRYRSGQYQPTVNGGVAAVVDPGDATVRMFIKDNDLYLGFDVNDQFVQYHSNPDRWDGFSVTMDDPAVREQDHELASRRLSFQVNQAGGATAADDLLTLVQQAGAQVAISLKSGTTVDTLGPGHDIDAGYTAELKIDLTKIGYPPGLGHRLAFLGVNLLDGDSFGNNYTASYGTHTWWYREYDGDCCPAWTLLSQAPVSGVESGAPKPPGGYVLLGSYPNPSALQTIRYSLAARSNVTLRVFDVGGRLVETRDLGVEPSGTREVLYDARALSAGLYLYQLKIADPETGVLRAALSGRMMVSR